MTRLLVREALAPPLAFRPGKGEGYSNVAYALLDAIVERASGERFEDAMRRRVFEPAGMSRTGVSGESGGVRAAWRSATETTRVLRGTLPTRTQAVASSVKTDERVTEVAQGVLRRLLA